MNESLSYVLRVLLKTVDGQPDQVRAVSWSIEEYRGEEILTYNVSENFFGWGGVPIDLEVLVERHRWYRPLL